MAPSNGFNAMRVRMRSAFRTGIWQIGVALLTVAATLLLFVGMPTLRQAARSSAQAMLRASGRAQLTSVAPMEASEDGAMCEWQDVSASMGSLAAFRQARPGGASGESSGTRPIDYSGMKPTRSIRDPYAAYSAVAVDPTNNEVVLTDENLFQILVYDRMANTPANASMTEPKRILGGLETKIEFQCGLYIDPNNGDIYAVNNDTVDTLVIFSRDQKGNVPPKRELITPHGTFGIAVDEGAQELFMTVQHENLVIVYPKNAQGKDAPLRYIQGGKTMLADPHGMAIDLKRQLIFVANHGGYHEKIPGAEPALSFAGAGGRDVPNWPDGGQKPGSGRNFPPSITVYPLKARGDVAPVAVIQGSKTRLNWPTGLAVDEEKGELYVANDMDDSIAVFDMTANGDVAPKRMIRGPKSLVKNPTGVWLDHKNKEVWSANFGNHSATVYPMDASGDVPPKRVIRSGPLEQKALGIGNPHPVGYDSKREQIIVPN
jgi:DNA-binding beta-propeller fold protein YncE